MGTHNGAAYIAEQLESILAGSVLPQQIVISDDASSDETLAVARATVADRVPLTVLYNDPALGVTRNFERAALACTSELVALSDQDDSWHPDRLAVAVAAFRDRPELTLLHADARLVDAAGSPLGHTLFEALEVSERERELVHSGRAIEALLRRNLVTGATTVFRRELLERATPFPPEWVHDEWLATIAAATGRVDLTDRTLIDYRQHGANQIGATRLGLRGKVRRVLEPRRARNERLARNFGILVERLAELDVTAEVRELAAGKLTHELVRLGLPEARLLRVLPVMREVRTGGYRAFSRGRGDILRDLVQPAD